MKLIPFLSNMNHPHPNPSPPWQWPSCGGGGGGGDTKTLSFRAPAEPDDDVEDPSSGDPVERVIRGLRSERLFFEPGETSSILEEAHSKSARGDDAGAAPYKESVAMSLDSVDPCADFRRSMEEMVAAHGLNDWEALEELLSCYLKVNCKTNHVYIVAAFVDLLLSLSSAGDSSSSYSPSSSNSFTISPSSPLSLSQLLDQDK